MAPRDARQAERGIWKHKHLQHSGVFVFPDSVLRPKPAEGRPRHPSLCASSALCGLCVLLFSAVSPPPARDTAARRGSDEVGAIRSVLIRVIRGFRVMPGFRGYFVTSITRMPA
jgi:hypothetical protein